MKSFCDLECVVRDVSLGVNTYVAGCLCGCTASLNVSPAYVMQGVWYHFGSVSLGLHLSMKPAALWVQLVAPVGVDKMCASFNLLRDPTWAF